MKASTVLQVSKVVVTDDIWSSQRKSKLERSHLKPESKIKGVSAHAKKMGWGISEDWHLKHLLSEIYGPIKQLWAEYVTFYIWRFYDEGSVAWRAWKRLRWNIHITWNLRSNQSLIEKICFLIYVKMTSIDYENDLPPFSSQIGSVRWLQET